MSVQDSHASAGVVIERFTADAEAVADGRFARWQEAVNFGFHDPRFHQEDLRAVADAFAADGRVMWGAYAGGASDAPGAWDRRVPVATYATMTHSLNVGGGRLLEAHQVTDVTVRPTHRRQGLLRRIMTADLTSAADKGFALAALTASEATIYGRFGFGAATFTRRIEVDVRERFAMLPPPCGFTEVAEPSGAAELAPDIFESFHRRTPGSVDRQYTYPRRAAGLWGAERPVEDKSIRIAIHYDDGGRPDGYVTYRFAGWESTPFTVKVLDLVAGSARAHLELWRYLGSLDLVERVTYDHASLEDPLPWALRDRRCYRMVGDDDVLWLRVLDPVKTLQAREYQADGEIRFTVSDPLDLAAGTYRLTVDGGSGTVEKCSDGAVADAQLDVAALGSLYLGGASAHALHDGGHLSVADTGVLARCAALFRTSDAPYCNTRF